MTRPPALSPLVSFSRPPLSPLASSPYPLDLPSSFLSFFVDLFSDLLFHLKLIKPQRPCLPSLPPLPSRPNPCPATLTASHRILSPSRFFLFPPRSFALSLTMLLPGEGFFRAVEESSGRGLSCSAGCSSILCEAQVESVYPYERRKANDGLC